MSDEKERDEKELEESLVALQLVCLLNSNLNDVLENDEETGACFMFQSDGFTSSIEFLGVQIWTEDNGPIDDNIEDMKKQVKGIMHKLRAATDVEELFKAPI